MKTINLTEKEKERFINVLKINKRWCTSELGVPECNCIDNFKECLLSSQYFFEHFFKHFSTDSLKVMGSSPGCMHRARALLSALDDMDKFEILMELL